MNRKKPKLLLFVEAFGGGVFTYIVDLTNQLSEKYDIYIAHGIREQTPEDYSTYFNDNIQLIRIKTFVREISAIQDLKALAEMKRIEKEIQPDIIHLHSSKAGVLGRIAFSGKKKKLFYTPHGYSFLMDDCSRVKKDVYKLIEKICGHRNCVTISCSEGEEAETVKLVKKSSYISNGVNISFLKELIESTPVKKENSVTVFTLGRICFQKNPELFNNIAKRLPQIHFIWIGDGELRETLSSPNIEVTGWISREEALSISKSANIFILTSLWEGLPISLLEAMYMKKVCLVTNVIGNKDVIKDSQNGFICSTVDEFVDVITDLTLSKKDQVSIVDHAYQDVLEEYNTEIMAEKYSRLYKNALGITEI